MAAYFAKPTPKATDAPAPAAKKAPKKAPAPAPAPKKAAPAPAAAADEDDWEKEADGGATTKAAEPPAAPAAPAAKVEEAGPVSADEIKELKKMLASGDISHAEFEKAMAGDDTEDAVVVEEEEAEVDASEEDPREHANVVFIGHVDAGKSTLSGNILYLTGQVDQRTIDKFEREAKDLNRESWFLAFIMDTSEEERAKGKTVEVGMAHFDTPSKRYAILDAPGHKNYVPNMIAGAAQADIGCLVVSARKGEFEAGFDRSGQTREHAMLAKTLGVDKLVVVINKMDDPTVKWSQKRFDECVTKLKPFLKGCGYKVKKDVTFVPISGLNGANVADREHKVQPCNEAT